MLGPCCATYIIGTHKTILRRLRICYPRCSQRCHCSAAPQHHLKISFDSMSSDSSSDMMASIGLPLDCTPRILGGFLKLKMPWLYSWSSQLNNKCGCVYKLPQAFETSKDEKCRREDKVNKTSPYAVCMDASLVATEKSDLSVFVSWTYWPVA